MFVTHDDLMDGVDVGMTVYPEVGRKHPSTDGVVVYDLELVYLA